jgi:hypothetical protein
VFPVEAVCVMFQVKCEAWWLAFFDHLLVHDLHPGIDALQMIPRPIKKADPNQPGKKFDDYWEAVCQGSPVFLLRDFLLIQTYTVH